MSRIYLSLILTLVFALFSIGWGLDQLSRANDQNTMQVVNSDYYGYRQFSQGLVYQLTQLSDSEKSNFIENYNKFYEAKISIISIKQVAFPKELIEKINNSALIVESENGAILMQKISHDYLLQMQLPKLDSPKNLSLIYSLSLYFGLILIALLWLTPLILRLKALDRSAQLFGLGKLDQRVKVSGHSYINNIEHSFNQMAQRIEELIEDNRLISGALSHDLRHPVACLKFGVDAIKESKNKEQYEKYLSRLEEDIERIDLMVMTFLEYAKLQQNKATINLQNCHVKKIINNAVESIHALNPTIEINSNVDENLNWFLDEQWFDRVLNNILKNSIEHDANKIKVIVINNENKLEIQIEDNGEGINEADRNKIFKPFVRLKSGRSLLKSNYGLGLSIVERVVHWHGGKVDVINPENLKGACFKITLFNSLKSNNDT